MISLPVGLLVKMLNEHKAEAEGEPAWGPDPYPKNRPAPSNYEPKQDEPVESALFNHGGGKLGKMYQGDRPKGRK
jgi:hypothetical protein